MTKQKIASEVGSLDVEGTAEYLMEQIEGYIRSYGAGNVTFAKESYSYGEGREYIAVYVNQLETDEQERHREHQEEQFRRQQAERERQQYEVLRKKFEDK